MHVDLPEKRYYSIGEVAEAFQVKPSLLRFWEKEFEQIQPKKKRKWHKKIYPRKCKNDPIYSSPCKGKRYDLRGCKKAVIAKAKR